MSTAERLIFEQSLGQPVESLHKMKHQVRLFVIFCNDCMGLIKSLLPVETKLLTFLSLAP